MACAYKRPGLVSVSGSASLRERWAKIYWLQGPCCVCGLGVYRPGEGWALSSQAAWQCEQSWVKNGCHSRWRLQQDLVCSPGEWAALHF